MQQAVDIYKSIPSDRMNGVKTNGFVIKDDNLLANEYNLVVGNRFNMQEMKDILPELAAHPQVVKAADAIAKHMPELIGAEKKSLYLERLRKRLKLQGLRKPKFQRRRKKLLYKIKIFNYAFLRI